MIIRKEAREDIEQVRKQDDQYINIELLRPLIIARFTLVNGFRSWKGECSVNHFLLWIFQFSRIYALSTISWALLKILRRSLSSFKIFSFIVSWTPGLDSEVFAESIGVVVGGRFVDFWKKTNSKSVYLSLHPRWRIVFTHM